MIYYIILYKVISHILLYSIIPYEDCHTDVVNHVRFHPADTSKLLSGAEDNLIALRSAGRRGGGSRGSGGSYGGSLASGLLETISHRFV